MTSCHFIVTWHEWNGNAGDIMVMWFASYVNLVMSHWACTSHVPTMQAPMMTCHLIPMWHEWNANPGDVMVMWFVSYVNLVMSQWACASHVHVHGTCAIIKISMLKYLNGLMGMPANSNSRKLTASHFNYPKCK